MDTPATFQIIELRQVDNECGCIEGAKNRCDCLTFGVTRDLLLA